LVLSCRVVYRTDEARSLGFAYGTLLGHPERGQESFHVRLDDQGVVSFHVVASSQPGDLATELALGRSPRHPVDSDAPLHKGHQEVRGERGQCTIRERVMCRYAGALRLDLGSDY
jgi:hypothetical protein